jgi:hypothetical protein
MSRPERKHDGSPSRRRYLVHLLCTRERGRERCGYIARIRPWSARSGGLSAGRERIFADECELIATINPLLTHGSDVRDVFEHIESRNGFYYLLHLTREEAGRLGWRS